MDTRRTAIETYYLVDSRATLEAIAARYLRALDAMLVSAQEYHDTRIDSGEPEKEVIARVLWRRLSMYGLVSAQEYAKSKKFVLPRSFRDNVEAYVERAMSFGGKRDVWFLMCCLRPLANTILETLSPFPAEVSKPLTDWRDSTTRRSREGYELYPAVNTTVWGDLYSVMLSASQKLRIPMDELLPEMDFMKMASSMRLSDFLQKVMDALAQLAAIRSTVTSTDPNTPDNNWEDRGYSIFLRVDNNTIWTIRYVSDDEEEAERMNHCGNRGQSFEGERVLSLRVFNREDKTWRAHATAILSTENLIGHPTIKEIVGHSNSNPFTKYGYACNALIADQRIAFVCDDQRWGYIRPELPVELKKKVTEVSKFNLHGRPCVKCGKQVAQPVYGGPRVCDYYGCHEATHFGCTEKCEECGKHFCEPHAPLHRRKDHTTTCIDCEKQITASKSDALDKLGWTRCDCSEGNKLLCPSCGWVCPECRADRYCDSCAAQHRAQEHEVSCDREGCGVVFVDPTVLGGEEIWNRTCIKCGGVFCHQHVRQAKTGVVCVDCLGE